MAAVLCCVVVCHSSAASQPEYPLKSPGVSLLCLLPTIREMAWQTPRLTVDGGRETSPTPKGANVLVAGHPWRGSLPYTLP